VPDLVALSPSCEAEVGPAFEWCLQHRGASWLRLESVPIAVPFAPRAGERLELGVGSWLRPGKDALFIGYGPALLSQAYRAAESLAGAGLSVGVVNLPWLNRIEGRWLLESVRGVPHVFALDNHSAIGGQGDRIAAILAGAAAGTVLHRCAVEGLPASGGNADVLRRHGLDADSLARRVQAALGGVTGS
jgi:transketolase